MAWWPGWDSIESTDFWNAFYFWFGIACLFLLGFSEVVSHYYGERHSNLVVAAASRRAEQQKQEDAETQRRHEAEAAALRQQLSDAQQQAESAAQKAVGAQQRAAALEAKGAPRSLTDIQRQKLIDVLRPFPGTNVNVVITLGDTEAHAYAGQFVAVFRAAGWDAGPNDGIDQAVYTGPPTYGIQVTMNEADARGGRFPTGAEPLVRALIALGLTKQAFVNSAIVSGKFEFRVGPKEP